MPRNFDIKAIAIGGSAGSIPVMCKILKSLPDNWDIPLIVCLHRMKNIAEGMVEVLNKSCALEVIEPDDKLLIEKSKIYLAPSNYHLLIEDNYSFSLSTDILENYSRPSIDITLESCAKIYKNNLLGIILTGANKDGVKGMCEIKNNLGLTIAQNPDECSAPFMPKAAILNNCIDYVLSTHEICNLINNINKYKLH